MSIVAKHEMNLFRKNIPSLSTDKWGNVGTILVIDDEMMLLDISQFFLEELGYSVILASGGKEGLDLYMQKQNKIDLVILDLTMPIISGREILNRIRTLNPNAKIIIWSGDSPEGVEKETLIKEGASGFLSKPYSTECLEQTLRKVLS